MPDSSDPRSRRVEGIKRLRELRRNPPQLFQGKPQSRWVTEEEGYILYVTLHAHNIERAIECGTANGYSTCWMVQSMFDRGVQVPEVQTWDPASRDKAWDHVAPFPVKGEEWGPYSDYINYHEEPFETVKEKYVPDDRRTAFFIDGDHSKGAVSRDWGDVEPLVRKGDVVIFHDAQGYAWIEKLVNRLSDSPEYNGGVITSQRGVGVIWRA